MGLLLLRAGINELIESEMVKNNNSSICSPKSMPLVSIVMPTRNSVSTIIDALESIANQSYKNIELIVIDGNSIDSTIEVIRNFLPTAKIFSQIGVGIWDAMNQGISCAEGEYIFSLNSDDLISSHAIEDLVQTAVSGSFDALWLPTYSAGGFRENVKPQKSWLGMDRAFPGHSASFLVRSSIHKELGLYDTSVIYCADYNFFHKLLIASKKIGSIASNRRAFGVFTHGGFSLSNSYILKALEECKYRFPYIFVNSNDLIYCFFIFPCKFLWYLKKRLISVLIDMRRILKSL